MTDRVPFFEKSKDKYRMFSIRSLLYAPSKALNYCSMSAIFQFLYLWSNTMYYASIKMILTYSQDLQRHQACDLILLPWQHRNLSFNITKFWKLLHIYMLFEGGRSVSRKTFWVFRLRSEAISLDVYISYIVLSELKPKMSSEGMRAVYNSGSVSLNIARAYISNQIIGFRIPTTKIFQKDTISFISLGFVLSRVT